MSEHTNAMRTKPRVLSVAGTDPSGGAGQSADLKTIGALGGYGMSVLTSIVPQNTQGVAAIHVLPPSMLAEQFAAVFDDANEAEAAVDAIKIGLVPDAASAEVVAAQLALHAPATPCVLDPVLVATSGHQLGPAVEILLELARHADLLTPNLPELAALTGREISGRQAAVEAAADLAASTGAAVVAKGGHADSPDSAVDILVGTPKQLALPREPGDGDLVSHPAARGGCEDLENPPASDLAACYTPPAGVGRLGGMAVVEFSGPRVATRNTHGTGCTLSSALATLRGAGMTWPQALGVAKPWVAGAIAAGASLGVGATDEAGTLIGHGPLDHFWLGD